MTLEGIRAREEKASEEVARLCARDSYQWRMSIPANPDKDSDLIISDSLADIRHLLAALKAVQAEVTQTAEKLREVADRMNQQVIDRDKGRHPADAERYDHYATQAEVMARCVTKTVRDALG